MSSWPGTVIISLTNFTMQQSRSFEGICVPLRLMNCLFPIPDSQPTATELFQSPLYRSGTVGSISYLLHHFPSSAIAWRHTSSNSVTRNYCCRAREVTQSFIDMLIALTYLLSTSTTIVILMVFWIAKTLLQYFTLMSFKKRAQLAISLVSIFILIAISYWWQPRLRWSMLLMLSMASICISDISVLRFISVLVSISFSVNHFYFYIISVLTWTII